MPDPSQPHDDKPLPADFDQRVAALEAYLANASSQPSSSASYWSGTRIHLSPWFWSIMGVVLSVITFVIWWWTFQPHGGGGLSGYLFPVSQWLLGWLYPHQSIPVAVWFGSILLHWPLIGVVIDVLRFIIRRARSRRAQCI